MKPIPFHFGPDRSLLVMLPNGDEIGLRPWPGKSRISVLSSREGSRKFRLGRRRLEAIRKTEWLHLDLRTPFGEDVSDSQIDSALKETLGNSYERYRLIGWHVMHIEDTHVGHVHRIFVTLEHDSHRPAQAQIADHRLPVELGILGIGEILGATRAATYWQLLFREGDRGVSAMMLGSECLHVLNLPWNPDDLSRWKNHGIVLSGKEILPVWSAKVYWPPNDWNPLRETASSWIPLNQALPAVGNDTQAGSKALALGLGRVLSREDMLSHDNVLRGEQVALRKRRLLQSAFASLLMLLAGIGAGLTAIEIQKNRLESRKAALTVAAAKYRDQVETLADLRSHWRAGRDSLNAMGPLKWKPYPISIVLSRLAEAGTKGGMDAFQVKRENNDAVDVRLKAWTSNWEGVEAFRHALSDIPLVSDLAIHEQQKENQSGRIRFEMSLRMGGVE